MTERPDIDAIAARAAAAPAGHWVAGVDCLQVPWRVPHDPDNWTRTDDDTGDPLRSGRWLAVQEGYWHAGSPDPGPELWEFLARARDDVLELVAEVRRLSAATGSRGGHAPRRRARRGRPCLAKTQRAEGTAQ